jgi:acetyl esterase/lipase
MTNNRLIAIITLTVVVAISSYAAFNHTVEGETMQFSKAAPLKSGEMTTISYISSGETELMDMLPPAGKSGPAPVVLCIHGGGWTSGSRADMTDSMTWLQSLGYFACSIDYRLAPQYPFPAQLEDCKCAVRYLRAHAKALNIDPSRIGVLGISAGSHLALMLAVTPNVQKFEGSGGWNDQPSTVKCVVGLEGPTDLGAAFGGSKTSAEVQGISQAFFGHPISQDSDAAAAASPMTYVKAGDPPMLLIHGEADTLVPVAQTLDFAAKLKANGDDVTVKIIPRLNHAGIGEFASPDNIALVQGFFDRALK